MRSSAKSSSTRLSSRSRASIVRCGARASTSTSVQPRFEVRPERFAFLTAHRLDAGDRFFERPLHRRPRLGPGVGRGVGADEDVWIREQVFEADRLGDAGGFAQRFEEAGIAPDGRLVDLERKGVGRRLLDRYLNVDPPAFERLANEVLDLGLAVRECPGKPDGHLTEAAVDRAQLDRRRRLPDLGHSPAEAGHAEHHESLR